MNFNLIENPDPYENINEFADDYNSHKYFIYELCDKYDWNKNTYRKVRREAIERGLIKDERYVCNKTIPKNYYYHKDSGLYCVVKTVNQERIYFGGYKTEKEAQLVVEELKKCNWDKSKLRSIKFKILCIK